MTASEQYAIYFPLAQEVALQLTRITKREWVAQAQAKGDYYNSITITSGPAKIHLGEEYLSKGTKVSIYGTTPAGKDRQHIRVYVPRIVDGQQQGWDEFKHASIGVAISRGPEVIAKEIARRFLPDYLKAVELTLAKIAADEKYEADRRSNLEACAATLNSVLRSDYQEVRGCDPIREPVKNFTEYLGEDCTGIRLEVTADNKDVDLKIDNLTVEQAKALLQFVKRDLPLLVYDKRAVASEVK